MSVRRFAVYFLALSAGSTVMFASAVIGQAAPPPLDGQEMAGRAASERFQQMLRQHSPYRHAPLPPPNRR